jgi:hypothetical protein
MCVAGSLRAGIGQTEVSDLALLDQVPDCTSNVLDGRVRIDPVLIE